MKKFIIDCFEAYTNSDLTEGRGHDVHIGYFTKESDAKKASKGKGVMGSDAYTRKVNKEIVIYESFEEYETRTRAIVRERTLSKLTYEEKKALGLI